MSEAVLFTMAQSWPWGSQVAVKKKKATKTKAIRGTPRDKNCKELVLESLQSRRLHCLCTVHKIKTTCLLTYFLKLIPDTSHY